MQVRLVQSKFTASANGRRKNAVRLRVMGRIVYGPYAPVSLKT